MKWSDIGTIGISDIVVGRPGWKPWIYFSADEVPVKYVTPKMVGEKFFMLNYRKSVIEEILKYWKGEIVNLYELPLPHEKRNHKELPFLERLRGNNWFVATGITFGFLWVIATGILSGPIIAPLGNDELLAIASMLLGFMIVINSMAIYLGGWKKYYGVFFPVAIIIITYMLLRFALQSIFQ